MVNRMMRGQTGTFATGLGIVAAMAGAVLFGWSGAAFAGPLRQAPNSRIAMDLPENFVPADRFSGFIDAKTGASFLIMEMPAIAFEELKAIGEKTEALAQKGVMETTKKDLPDRSGEYVYVTGRQHTAAGNYGKFIMVMRESDLTAMITANIPQQALDSNSITLAQIERALASATVKADAIKGEDLFSLSYLGPFKETITVLGNSKAYSLTGKLPEPGAPRSNVDPILVVSPSADKRPIPNVQAAAQASFRSIGGLSAHQTKGEKNVVIAGLKGYEIFGEGKDGRTGEQTGLYVLLLTVEGGGYYVIAGSAAAGDMPTYLPEFQKIALGFTPKTP
jgi:hypothetical protein